MLVGEDNPHAPPPLPCVHALAGAYHALSPGCTPPPGAFEWCVH